MLCYASDICHHVILSNVLFVHSCFLMFKTFIYFGIDKLDGFGRRYQHIITLYTFSARAIFKGLTVRKLVSSLFMYFLFSIFVGIDFVDLTWESVSMRCVLSYNYALHVTELARSELTLCG